MRKGDITRQTDIAAVVNAANAQLRTGGGVAGAMHRAAGPGLEKECRPLAPIRVGEAVITGAHNLPNQYVIHCLGPVYGADHPEEKLLADCYRNALQLADAKGISSVAFAYPLDKAAHIAVDTIVDIGSRLKSVRQIVMVLYSDHEFQVHKTCLEQRPG